MHLNWITLVSLKLFSIGRTYLFLQFDYYITVVFDFWFFLVFYYQFHNFVVGRLQFNGTIQPTLCFWLKCLISASLPGKMLCKCFGLFVMYLQSCNSSFCELYDLLRKYYLLCIVSFEYTIRFSGTSDFTF